MINRRFAATLGSLALVLAACTGDGGDSSEPAASEPATSDAPASESAAAAATASSASRGTTTRKSAGHCATSPPSRPLWMQVGAEYISADAGSSEEQQANDVENLLSQGANVIIILAQNTETILPVGPGGRRPGHRRSSAMTDSSRSAYVLYISFDNVAVGRCRPRPSSSRSPRATS